MPPIVNQMTIEVANFRTLAEQPSRRSVFCSLRATIPLVRLPGARMASRAALTKQCPTCASEQSVAVIIFIGPDLGNSIVNGASRICEYHRIEDWHTGVQRGAYRRNRPTSGSLSAPSIRLDPADHPRPLPAQTRQRSAQARAGRDACPVPLPTPMEITRGETNTPSAEWRH